MTAPKSASVATDMDRTWLIQRLQRPRSATILGADNPFAFGGGYRNGGLSDEAMGLLRSMWSFDYMGAAEFEFGAVPKALNVIAKQADEGVLLHWQFDILLSQVAPDWRDKTKPERGAKGTVYALARTDWQEEVERRVRELAKQGYTARLKEGTRLSGALRPHNEWDSDTCGWLELDNGFLFFTDRDMWQAACGLFGIDVEPSSKSDCTPSPEVAS